MGLGFLGFGLVSPEIVMGGSGFGSPAFSAADFSPIAAVDAALSSPLASTCFASVGFGDAADLRPRTSSAVAAASSRARMTPCVSGFGFFDVSGASDFLSRFDSPDCAQSRTVGRRRLHIRARPLRNFLFKLLGLFLQLACAVFERNFLRAQPAVPASRQTSRAANRQAGNWSETAG